MQYHIWHFLCGILPSLAIGVTAFCASEMLFGDKEDKSLRVTNKGLYETLETAKMQNKEIIGMVNKIEDREITKNLTEIYETVNKIISTIETKPSKIKKISNFFDYYLPVTIKMLKKYDEIENQGLISQDGKKFMKQAKDMISSVNEAFKKQLAMLYQSDLTDADAEMKVLDMMLKTDGFDTSDFDLNKDEEEN